MNALDLLASPLAERLTWTLLHFVWQGLLVAALLAAGVRLCRVRRAAARYACSLAALVSMALLPVATFVMLEEGRSEISAMRGHMAEPGTALGAALEAGVWQPLLLAAWMTGVLLLAARLLAGLAQVRALRRHVLPLPERLTAQVELLGRRLDIDALPLVFLSERVAEALVIGVLRPVVLVPAAWITEMPPAMLQAVIAHELAHIRRRDLWLNFAQRIVETLLFYHPAVWWLGRRLRQEREMCCDELAVLATGQRGTYVTTLELVARWRLVGVRPALAAGIRGEKNMRLLERVRNVLGSSSTERTRLWPIGILAIALPLVIWAAAWSLPETGSNIATADEREGDKPNRDGERRDGGRKVAPESEADRFEFRTEEVRRDGDRPREKDAPRDGDRPREKDAPRDGDRPREKDAPRDGDRPREKDAPRDGDARKEGPRDGEVRKEGDAPRDGERRKVIRFERKELNLRDDALDGDGDMRALIGKLAAEIRQLRAEVAELRGTKKPAPESERDEAEKIRADRLRKIHDAVEDEEILARQRLKKEIGRVRKEGEQREAKEGDQPRKEKPNAEGFGAEDGQGAGFSSEKLGIKEDQ